MPDTLEPLILDLVEWVAREPRAYTDVMDAWRTSCPRLTVWEDAAERGLLARDYVAGRVMVSVTSAGWALLGTHGRRAWRDGHAPFGGVNYAESPTAALPASTRSTISPHWPR